MIVLDTMEKTAGVLLLQAELNDQPGVCLKFTGSLGDLQAAVASAEQAARKMEMPIVADVIPGPAPGSPEAYQPRPDFNPLIEQATVHTPEDRRQSPSERPGGAR